MRSVKDHTKDQCQLDILENLTGLNASFEVQKGINMSIANYLQQYMRNHTMGKGRKNDWMHMRMTDGVSCYFK